MRSGIVLIALLAITPLHESVKAGPTRDLASPKQGDLSRAAAPDLTTAAENWIFKNDAPAKTSPLRGSIRLLGVKPVPPGPPNQKPYLATGSIAFTGQPTDQVLISYHSRDPRGFNVGNRYVTVESRIVRVDLKTGQQLATITLPRGLDLLAVSADGSAALTQDIQQAGDPSRIDFFRLPKASGPAQHLAAWTPAAAENGLNSADWGAVVSPELALTFTASSGQLTCWKVPDCTAVWTIKSAVGFDPPALSPGGKLVAAIVDKTLFVLEAQSGVAVAKFEPGRCDGKIAWHPDGSHVSVVGTNCLVWDLTSGQKTSDFPMPNGGQLPAGTMPGLNWCGRRYLILNWEYLLDPQLKMIVWRYVTPTVGPRIIGQPDARFWTCTEQWGGTLVGLDLPQPAARKVLDAVQPNAAPRGPEGFGTSQITAAGAVPAGTSPR